MSLASTRPAPLSAATSFWAAGSSSPETLQRYLGGERICGERNRKWGFPERKNQLDGLYWGHSISHSLSTSKDLGVCASNLGWTEGGCLPLAMQPRNVSLGINKHLLHCDLFHVRTTPNSGPAKQYASSWVQSEQPSCVGDASINRGIFRIGVAPDQSEAWLESGLAVRLP